MRDSSDVEAIGEFGLAVWAPEFRQIAEVVRGLAVGGRAKVLIDGPVGSGKTYIAGLPMILGDTAKNWLYVADELTGDTYRDIREGRFDLIICDDGHLRSAGLEMALQATPSPWLVTCDREGLPRLRGTGRVISLPSINEDREGRGVLILADFLFKARTGLDLIEALPEEARRVLQLARWYRNGHSVSLFVNMLVERLRLQGQLIEGGLHGSVGFSEVSDIVEEVMVSHAPRDEFMDPSRPTVVVEGLTDVYWLQAAARAHRRMTGIDLLQGVVIDDAQGADNVLARVVYHKNLRRPVVGLVDGDSIGVHHAQEGRKMGATILIVAPPADFPPPPFGAEPEIEDLARIELVDSYYALHNDDQPEVKVIYRGHVRRILPDRGHKFALAEWCSDNGTAEDFAEIVKLLTRLRESLRMGAPESQRVEG